MSKATRAVTHRFCAIEGHTRGRLVGECYPLQLTNGLSSTWDLAYNTTAFCRPETISRARASWRFRSATYSRGPVPCNLTTDLGPHGCGLIARAVFPHCLKQ